MTMVAVCAVSMLSRMAAAVGVVGRMRLAAVCAGVAMTMASAVSWRSSERVRV